MPPETNGSHLKMMVEEYYLDQTNGKRTLVYICFGSLTYGMKSPIVFPHPGKLTRNQNIT